jgi:hypothetical protein
MPVHVTIKTDITDLRKLLNILAHAERYEIPAAIKKTTKNIERDAKKAIRTGSRSGTHYSGQPNRSSAPGEAPKSQTGFLANSIGSRFTHNNKTGSTLGVVGSTTPRGLWLEFGAHRRKGGYLAPRPWLRPAIEKNIPLLTQDIINRLS